MSVGRTLWILGKILKWKEKGGVGVTGGFALCSVLVYLSLASAEAVTRRLQQSFSRRGNRSVGAETLSSGEKPGGNTWGSGCVGGEGVGEGGFIVALVA